MLVMFVIYILFVWMGYKKQIKKAVFSHFAECNGHDTHKVTIWKHALPSARLFAECLDRTLGK